MYPLSLLPTPPLTVFLSERGCYPAAYREQLLVRRLVSAFMNGALLDHSGLPGAYGELADDVRLWLEERESHRQEWRHWLRLAAEGRPEYDGPILLDDPLDGYVQLHYLVAKALLRFPLIADYAVEEGLLAFEKLFPVAPRMHGLTDMEARRADGAIAQALRRLDPVEEFLRPSDLAGCISEQIEAVEAQRRTPTGECQQACA